LMIGPRPNKSESTEIRPGPTRPEPGPKGSSPPAEWIGQDRTAYRSFAEVDRGLARRSSADALMGSDAIDA
jgi:hypothetical protein